MDHSHHAETTSKEYLKFSVVIFLVLAIALLHSSLAGFSFTQFGRSFMGAFLIVFASFKLLNLKMFAEGFASYDVIARKSLAYGYAYPFIQLVLGLSYLFGVTSPWLDVIMIVVSLVSSIGVFNEKSRHIKCLCLGNFVQLPLSTISLIEDLGMAALAAVMLLTR